MPRTIRTNHLERGGYIEGLTAAGSRSGSSRTNRLARGGYIEARTRSPRARTAWRTNHLAGGGYIEETPRAPPATSGPGPTTSQEVATLKGADVCMGAAELTRADLDMGRRPQRPAGAKNFSPLRHGRSEPDRLQPGHLGQGGQGADSRAGYGSLLRDSPRLDSFSPGEGPAWVEGEQFGRGRGGKSGGNSGIRKKETVKSNGYDHFPFLARPLQ